VRREDEEDHVDSHWFTIMKRERILGIEERSYKPPSPLVGLLVLIRRDSSSGTVIL